MKMRCAGWKVAWLTRHICWHYIWHSWDIISGILETLYLAFLIQGSARWFEIDFKTTWSRWVWGICSRAHPRTRHHWLLKCAKLRLHGYQLAVVSSRVCHWLVQFLLISVVGLLLQVVFYEALSIPEKDSWLSNWGPQGDIKPFGWQQKIHKTSFTWILIRTRDRRRRWTFGILLAWCCDNACVKVREKKAMKRDCAWLRVIAQVR